VSLLAKTDVQAVKTYLIHWLSRSDAAQSKLTPTGWRAL
jgi:hypothetical protein